MKSFYLQHVTFKVIRSCDYLHMSLSNICEDCNHFTYRFLGLKNVQCAYSSVTPHFKGHPCAKQD